MFEMEVDLMFRYKQRLTMTLRVALVAGMSAASLGAQQSAMGALKKARVLEWLADAMPARHQGTTPGFVLDPAWPKPLPHHWIVGDIGGIFVDRRDHIWVYHRPRSLGSTDSGMLGEAGKDAKARPISALVRQ